MKSYKQSSAENNKQNSKGMLITTPEYRGNVWKPKWHNKLRLETHFRPVGPLTDDQKNFLPWRYTGEDNDFGPWIANIPLYTGGTYKTMTFIPAYQDPNSPGDALDTTIHPTPATEFLDAAKRIAYDDTSGRLKNMLIQGGQNRGPALPKRINSVGLIQGILLRHGDRDYYQKPQMPCMLMLSPSACIALNEELNKEVEGYQGTPDDYDSRFACGDIIGVETGRILSFYNGLTKHAGTEDAAATVDWNQASAGNDKKKTTTELAHYVCDILTVLPLPRLPDGKIKFAVENELFVPWEKAIRFLDQKEMLDTIVQAYQDLPGLLLQCLKQYHEQLPDFVKGNATVQVPDGVPAATTAAPSVADNILGPQVSAEEAVAGAIGAQTATPAATPAATAETPTGVVNWDGASTPAPAAATPAAATPAAATPAAATPAQPEAKFADNIQPGELYDANAAATPAAAAPAPAGATSAAPAEDAKVQAAMDKLNALRNKQTGAATTAAPVAQQQ